MVCAKGNETERVVVSDEFLDLQLQTFASFDSKRATEFTFVPSPLGGA